LRLVLLMQHALPEVGSVTNTNPTSLQRRFLVRRCSRGNWSQAGARR